MTLGGKMAAFSAAFFSTDVLMCEGFGHSIANKVSLRFALRPRSAACIILVSVCV